MWGKRGPNSSTELSGTFHRSLGMFHPETPNFRKQLAKIRKLEADLVVTYQICL
jgi:hypothetical protein